jgi:hypothetical protein
VSAQVQEAIVARLAADATVAALVGARISPAPLPQDTAFPAITYLRVTGRPERVMGNAPTLNSPLIQIDCWSQSYGQASQLAAAVLAALTSYSGTYTGPNGSVDILGILVEDQRDQPDPDPQLARVSVDVTVWQRWP